MKQKLLSLIVVLVMMTLLFAGCGKSESSVGTETDTNGSEGGEEEELVELHIAMFAAGDASDAQLVEDAVNEILREEMNAEVKIDFINFGAYRQQTNLMLSSGEEFDLMPTLMTPTLAAYVASGQFLPLDDLLEEYGQDIITNIPKEYIECGRVAGEIYGITTNRDLAASYGFTFRKDLADKYGIKAEDIKTLDDVEVVLRIIKENEPDLYPLVPQTGAYIASKWGEYDDLGDGNWLGVLLDGGTTFDVVNYYDSDDFKDFVYETRSWYEDGLIMPDILNNTDVNNAIVKNGKGFGYLSNIKPGFDIQETKAAGTEMVTVELIPAYSTTSNVQGIVWAIPSNSDRPDKAMELLNIMYNNVDISNLLIYGIEGKHYEVIDVDNGIIGYPEGVEATTTGYPGGLGWGWPNQFLGYIWEGNPADYWEQMDTFNRTATPSGALGFVFNAEEVSTEMAACANVIDQYKTALMGGVIDPDEALPKFNEDLEEAGMNNIIAEKQKQLDEWVTSQK